MNDAFKYFAFISYNAKDLGWGKKLQKKLEHYKLPATLCSEHGWQRKPIRPVFFAPTDIQPGRLSNELQERLKAAQHLIVICSPNSAKSEWVGREIEFFYNLGRANNIHFFIVDGIPHTSNPETECFNPVIDKLELPEILGANIHEKIYRWPWLNKERAYVQLISKLLGVEFDTIWQRHKRQLIRKSLAWGLGCIAVIAALLAVRHANQPFDSVLQLEEASIHNEQLPPLHNAVVTLTLDNETKKDTVRTLDDMVTFTNIPHHFLNRSAHITVTCMDFLITDTIMSMDKAMTVKLYRDPSVYGNIHFSLWNTNEEKVVTHALVEIEGQETFSNDSGTVTLFIPIEKQRKAYQIKSEILLVNDSIIMPCGENDVIMVR